MTDAGSFSIKIFADGADLETMVALGDDPKIAGFTTNPTLMAQSGIDDYAGFARKVLDQISDRPISFEVFSDDLTEMVTQAREIASWGENVYVKIPVTNTEGESCAPIIRTLSRDGLRLNVTAVFTPDQVRSVTEALKESPGAIVSVFAGRIADAGADPLPIMREALEILSPNPAIELLWASPREVLNICQADAIGCHIITVTTDLLRKLPGIGKDLEEFSLETVKMFYADGQKAGFRL